MYERFYELQERPFDLVPNPRYLFLTPRQREALVNMQYGLTTPRGLTLLLGEAGTGKTTLVQAALAGVKDSRAHCVLLSNPTLTRSEFYEFLTEGFGLTEGVSKTRFLFQLRRYLEEQMADGVVNALVLDEAQSLPYELLEEVRLLSNIETTTAKLLNVVLAGQPELADRLNEPSLRQLKQRISLRCELAPMTLGETASYIAGRIRIAGGRPDRIFTQEAVSAIYAASGGIPRTVNVICDNALIGGFAAEMSPITADLVCEVCEDFDLRTDAGSDGNVVLHPFARKAVAAGVGVAVPAEGEEPRGDRGAALNDRATAPLFGLVNRKRRFSFF